MSKAIIPVNVSFPVSFWDRFAVTRNLKRQWRRLMTIKYYAVLSWTNMNPIKGNLTLSGLIIWAISAMWLAIGIAYLPESKGLIILGLVVFRIVLMMIPKVQKYLKDRPVKAEISRNRISRTETEMLLDSKDKGQWSSQ